MNNSSKTKFLNDQLFRKRNSEEIAIQNRITIDPELRLTESEADVKLRTADEIVDRALGIIYYAAKGDGEDEDFLAELDERYNSLSKLTLAEKFFCRHKDPTKQMIIDAYWRYECFKVLLWAVSFVEELDFPSTDCYGDDLLGVFEKYPDEAAFRKAAKLRTAREILDQKDLAFRLDWACNEAKMNDEFPPGFLVEGTVYLRHYAFNWLTCDRDAEWDEVQTNTHTITIII